MGYSYIGGILASDICRSVSSVFWWGKEKVEKEGELDQSEESWSLEFFSFFRIVSPCKLSDHLNFIMRYHSKYQFFEKNKNKKKSIRIEKQKRTDIWCYQT
jgi:hypothetical protein